MTPDDPIDIGWLDADNYSGTEDRVVRAAMTRIRAAIGRAPARPTHRAQRARWWERVSDDLVAMRVVVLATAAVIFVVATVVGADAPRTEQPATVAAALGVPAMIVGWIGGRTASSADVWTLSNLPR